MLLASGPEFLVVVPRTLVVIAALGIWALPAPVASATTFDQFHHCEGTHPLQTPPPHQPTRLVEAAIMSASSALLLALHAQ